MDLEFIKKRAAADRQMDTWQMKPGTGAWCNGYYFEFAIALEDIPAGSFIQRVRPQQLQDRKEEGMECMWIKWIPADPALQPYPEAFVLHNVGKTNMFWAQHLCPYQEVPGSGFTIAKRIGQL